MVSLRIKLLLLAFHIVLFVLNGTPFVLGDGFGYFHTATSLVTQGSFTTKEPPAYYPYSGHTISYYAGNYVTPYSPGTSLIWFPLLTLDNIFAQGSVYNDYYKAFNGHSLYSGIAILIAAVAASYIALFTLIRLGLKLGLSSRASVLLSAATYFGYFVFTYSFELPAYSHVYEFCIASLLLYLLLTKQRARYAFVTGGLLGLLVLIRPTNAVYALLLVSYLPRRRFRELTMAIIGGLPFAAIWVWYNYVSFGKLITSGYSILWQQSFELTKFNLIPLLVSDVRGLFIYTPIALLGLIGLWQHKHKYYFLATFLLTIVIYSFWPIWWAGESLGNRFFISLAPVTFVGLIFLYQTFPKLSRILVTTFTLYALMLSALWRITPVQKVNIANNGNIPASENYSPTSILTYHTSRLSELGLKGYLGSLPESWHGGRTILMLLAGLTVPLIYVEKVSEDQFRVYLISDNLGRTKTTPIALNNTIEVSFFTLSDSKPLRITCRPVCKLIDQTSPSAQFIAENSFSLGDSGSLLQLPQGVSIVNNKLKP